MTINLDTQGRAKFAERTVASVPLPAAGTITVFADSVTGKLCQLESDGTVTNLSDSGLRAQDVGTAAYADIGAVIPYNTITLTVPALTTAKLFTVANAKATTSAKILAYVQAKSNNLVDELECDPIAVHASCTVDGSINFILSCPWTFSGMYIVNYTIGY